MRLLRSSWQRVLLIRSLINSSRIMDRQHTLLSSSNVQPNSSADDVDRGGDPVAPPAKRLALSVERLQSGSNDDASSHIQGRNLAKKLRYAMLISYCGANYAGMQIQSAGHWSSSDCGTIERHLFCAFEKAGIVKATEAAQEWHFQRGSRTDKGVSACRQIINMDIRMKPEQAAKLPLLLNSHLPDDIRIMGIKRATRCFNSKNWCDSRTYSYTLPSYSFCRYDQEGGDDFRLNPDQIANIDCILDIYKGTHNFFNFTSNMLPTDRSCMRHIISCRCLSPFVLNNVEFVSIEIKGNSFMLHQIRKMIGLAIAVLRGLTSKEAITEAYIPKRMNVPKAPGLGLLLEKLHYEGYDKKYGKTHQSMELWPECEDAVTRFRKEKILPSITDGEIKDRIMRQWLTLVLGNYYSNSAQSQPSSPSDSIDSDVDNDKTTSEDNHCFPTDASER